jgi:hypothetical protein
MAGVNNNSGSVYSDILIVVLEKILQVSLIRFTVIR